MPYFALIYQVVPRYVERRAPFREEHLRLASAASDRGELLFAGALGDPPDQALLVFRGADRSAAEAFARLDPYVRAGLVVRWDVKPWAVAAGSLMESRESG